jgi:peptidoglycan hydrolase-like protein with peptidoglycan-binding domain
VKQDVTDRRGYLLPSSSPTMCNKALPSEFRARPAVSGLLVLLGAICASLAPAILIGPAAAQQSARTPASVFDAAQKAFEALPMDKRREIQDGLIWSGHYKGGVDGEFGRMTMGAIQAYEAQGKGPRDGVLTLQDVAALTAAANRRKTALGFREVTDPRSGVRIGVPTKFLKRRNLRDGSIYEARDKGITLRTFETPESQRSLADLYEDLRAPAPGRRIAYRVLRDDFLVVSVIDRGRFYYTRVARGVPGGGARQPANEMRTDSSAVLRGYTLSISPALMQRQRAQMNILTIAVSNSFEPFPSSAPGTASGKKAGEVSVAKRSDVLKPMQPVQETLVATAITVANDNYLTVLDPKACKSVRIGKAPAKLVARDAGTGLALYSAQVGGGRVLQSAGSGVAATGKDALVLYAELPSPGANQQISLARGSFAASAGKAYVKIIALDSAAGGVAVNSGGQVVGLLVRASPDRRRIAGPVPPPSRSMLAPATVSSFLAKAGIATKLFAPADAAAPGSPGNTASPGSIAQMYSRSLAAVWCVSNQPQ